METFKKITKFLGLRREQMTRFARIPGFAQFAEVETQKLSVHAVRLICSMGAISYMLVGIADYMLYPDLFQVFLMTRIAFAVGCIITVFLTFTPWGQKQAQTLVFFNALFGELIVCYMVSQLSGWTSLYFVGNLLITNTVTMFVPWPPGVQLLYCALSLFGYLGIVGYVHPFSNEMFIPLAFISVNNLHAYFSSLSSRISRMNQWASRLEVEKAHADLKALDEAKARFFSNISHELRTPLTLLIGPLGALAKRGGGWVSQELVVSMSLNAQRLLRQVNALLDLGKIDSQEMKCHLEPGNLKKLIFDLYQASAPGAQERGITILFEVPQEIPDSMFDGEKIETIIANLISNALKFTPAKGTVTLHCELLPYQVLRLSVRDTGAGIPSDQLEKIFGRFHQVQSAQKKVSKGTGLGLSVAKEFAELHGGKIWVESEVGVGTQFYVEIPFIPANAPVANAETDAVTRVREEARTTLLVDVSAREDSESDGVSIANENVRRMRERAKQKAVLLYVDDSADLRQYVNSILGDSYTLLLAQDGDQGFEQAKIYNPDLILSDVMMPKCNGFDLCRRVRGDADLKSTPFILLTANSSLDSRIEGLQEGADDYLSKPFSERELVARIKNLVTLRQQAQMIKKQIDAAKKIQQALLPPPVQVLQGVLIEALYEPSAELSGDFFDTVISGEWVYVYVADVTGHGLAAAQITYLVKEIFTHALAKAMDLPELFNVVRTTYLERQLEYDLGLQLMRIRATTGDVEYLRSNAPNPVLVTAEDQVEELDMPVTTLISSAMSLSSHRPAEIAMFKLEAGSSLYCFSDGAYEFTLASGQEFGMRKLVRNIKTTHKMVWPEGLLGSLRAENNGQFFPDDLTILRISLS